MVHHKRGEGGEVHTRIVAGGTLELQPPGIALEAEALFSDAS